MFRRCGKAGKRDPVYVFRRYGKVDVDWLLGVGAFSLEHALKVDEQFRDMVSTTPHVRRDTKRFTVFKMASAIVI